MYIFYIFIFLYFYSLIYLTYLSYSFCSFIALLPCFVNRLAARRICDFGSARLAFEGASSDEDSRAARTASTRARVRAHLPRFVALRALRDVNATWGSSSTLNNKTIEQ